MARPAGESRQIANLIQDYQHQLAELQSLQRTTAALLQRTSLDDVLAVVCAEAQQLTQATGSAVLLYTDETWLQVMASTGTPSPSLARISLDKSFAGPALKQGKPLLLNDPQSEMQAYYRDPGLESLLVIPLSLDGDLVGAMDVVNRPGGFSEEDVRIMMLFADPAALAIQINQLHQQAHQLAVAEERHRLARELHDSVTQTLYSVSLYADAARMALVAGMQEALVENLDELQGMVRQAMLDMRLLIYELYPPALELEGLVAALQTRLESVEARAGVKAQFHADGESHLSLAAENELYRIAQEALNNVAKHAHAQHVTVNIRFSPAQVCLEIGDDGTGFDPVKARHTGGLGLRSIEDRVQRLGGDLAVESMSGEGATLRIVIPTPGRTSVE